MAQFLPALEVVLAHEGFPGYNIDNNGAEVCAGINRAYWPGWDGWQVVDKVKAKYGDRKKINEVLRTTPNMLRAFVGEFYMKNFWTEKLAALTSQDLANWMLDKYVQCYFPQTNRFLQRALGVTDDGVFGPATLAAANVAEPKALIERCREEARKFYAELHEKDSVKYPKSMAERA